MLVDQNECSQCVIRAAEKRLEELAASRVEMEKRHQEQREETQRRLNEMSERRADAQRRLGDDTAREAAIGAKVSRNSAKARRNTTTVIGALGALLILSTFAWLKATSSATPASAIETTAQTVQGTDASTSTGPSDVELLTYSQTETKQALEAKLKDPDTAKYRNVAAYHVAGKYAFCGEVNAKNGFGGYSGFERFVGVPNQAFLESEVTGFDEVWANFCNPAQKGPPIWW